MVETDLINVDTINKLSPMRSCCVCRSVLPKSKLNRITVSNKSDVIYVNYTSKSSINFTTAHVNVHKHIQGRGLYYCTYSECSSDFNEQKFAKTLYGGVMRLYIKLHNKNKAMLTKPTKQSKSMISDRSRNIDARSSSINGGNNALQPSLIICCNNVSFEFNLHNLTQALFFNNNL